MKQIDKSHEVGCIFFAKLKQTSVNGFENFNLLWNMYQKVSGDFVHFRTDPNLRLNLPTSLGKVAKKIMG